MNSLLMIVVGGVLVNNFIMSQFLGICPFLGVSKKTETALGMGMAVTFVMAIASLFTFIVQRYLLIPFHLEYMQTIAFILIIAVLVQTVEIVLKKMSRSLYEALGVYLPLITTNCAVLGVAINNTTAVEGGYNLIESVVNGTAGALGFTLAIVLFAAIRERLAIGNLPKWMEGFPGALIGAGLMSIAFQGFAGLIH
ncbi:MAG: electron transport complex subunit RsxA [Candidatus Limiplasma sp.]|nr:electron transport complex subunit RsxA [Candidatus Limiplasma sp.]